MIPYPLSSAVINHNQFYFFVDRDGHALLPFDTPHCAFVVDAPRAASPTGTQPCGIRPNFGSFTSTGRPRHLLFLYHTTVAPNRRLSIGFRIPPLWVLSLQGRVRRARPPSLGRLSLGAQTSVIYRMKLSWQLKSTLPPELLHRSCIRGQCRECSLMRILWRKYLCRVFGWKVFVHDSSPLRCLDYPRESTALSSTFATHPAPLDVYVLCGWPTPIRPGNP